MKYWKPTTTEIARFWTKVRRTDNIDDCWEWTGYCHSPGQAGRYNPYGYFTRESRKSEGRPGGMTLAHRYSLELKLGRQIAEGMVAMHSCDNPRCCNPHHLSEATYAANSEDAIRKGLFDPKGKRGPRKSVVYLSREEAEECLATCSTAREANERYGISEATYRRWVKEGLPQQMGVRRWRGGDTYSPAKAKAQAAYRARLHGDDNRPSA